MSPTVSWCDYCSGIAQVWHTMGTATYTVLTKDRLDPGEKILVQSALDALALSYAPYSNFKVGAAVLDERDLIFKGSNQENASYPLCVCAERVALYHAAQSHREIVIRALAVTAQSAGRTISQPAMPCGACRQVIKEYEVRGNRPIALYMVGQDEIWKFEGIDELLPYSFDGRLLL